MDKNRPSDETPPPDDRIPFGKRKIAREELQMELEALAQKELEALGMDVPTVETPPADSCKPDGSPWLTKEQILEKLDRTLCLRDKARVQRTAEEDANKCMLCWLGRRISKEIVVEEQRNIAPENWRSSFEWIKLRNPNFPQGTGILRCGSRECDDATMGKGENPDSWKETESQQWGAEHAFLWLDSGPWCEDGAYDIALEYWNRITERPWIEIPDEPALLPSDENERWVLFEKGSDGRYDDIVFLPPAIPHLEWEKKYYGESLGDYVNKHAGDFRHRWLVGIDYKTECDLNGLELDRKFNKTDRAKKDPQSHRIWFQREDGTREQIPGVFYPSLGVWKKKRLGEWISIGRRIEFWLALEKTGHIGKDSTREARFRKLSEQIVEYLDHDGPEPDDDIDLKETIPESEQKAIDQFLDHWVKQTVESFMKEGFPLKFNFSPRDKIKSDGQDPPDNERRT